MGAGIGTTFSLWVAYVRQWWRAVSAVKLIQQYDVARAQAQPRSRVQTNSEGTITREWKSHSTEYLRIVSWYQYTTSKPCFFEPIHHYMHLTIGQKPTRIGAGVWRSTSSLKNSRFLAPLGTRLTPMSSKIQSEFILPEWIPKLPVRVTSSATSILDFRSSAIGGKSEVRGM